MTRHNPRTLRRIAERDEARRNEANVAPAEWSVLNDRQKRRAVQRNARQLAVCPHCQGPVDGLLAGCNKPDCLSADLDEDVRLERLGDI